MPGQPTGFLPHHGKLASNGMLYISYSNGAGPYDGSSGDVWKFDTSNGTWTRISPVPSTDTGNDFFGYGGLSVDAQNPNVLVVAALNSWWPDTILFRSLDGGSSHLQQALRPDVHGPTDDHGGKFAIDRRVRFCGVSAGPQSIPGRSDGGATTRMNLVCRIPVRSMFEFSLPN